MMFGNDTILMGSRSSRRRPRAWGDILSASEGERADDLDQFFSAGYTLATPHFGLKDGVHLRVLRHRR